MFARPRGIVKKMFLALLVLILAGGVFLTVWTPSPATTTVDKTIELKTLVTP